MKAKEYLAKFDKDTKEVGDREATVNLMTDFLHEVGTLAEARNAESNAAMLSIIRELNQKWDTLCKLDGYKRFKKGGFIKLIRHRVLTDHPIMARRILPLLDKI